MPESTADNARRSAWYLIDTPSLIAARSSNPMVDAFVRGIRRGVERMPQAQREELLEEARKALRDGTAVGCERIGPQDV